MANYALLLSVQLFYNKVLPNYLGNYLAMNGPEKEAQCTETDEL